MASTYTTFDLLQQICPLLQRVVIHSIDSNVHLHPAPEEPVASQKKLNDHLQRFNDVLQTPHKLEPKEGLPHAIRNVLHILERDFTRPRPDEDVS